MTLVKFSAEHLARIDEQPAMRFLRPFITGDQLWVMERSPWSFTALDGDRVLASGGVHEWWPNRGEAWLFAASDLRDSFVSLFRTMRQILKNCPLKRIEATVKADFPEGHRLAKLLGFELEAPRLAHYFPTGDDAALYVRIR